MPVRLAEPLLRSKRIRPVNQNTASHIAKLLVDKGWTAGSPLIVSLHHEGRARKVRGLRCLRRFLQSTGICDLVLTRLLQSTSRNQLNLGGSAKRPELSLRFRVSFRAGLVTLRLNSIPRNLLDVQVFSRLAEREHLEHAHCSTSFYERLLYSSLQLLPPPNIYFFSYLSPAGFITTLDSLNWAVARKRQKPCLE